MRPNTWSAVTLLSSPTLGSHDGSKEDDPAGADGHKLLGNSVRSKTTSVLLRTPEADPGWQDAKEMGNSGESLQQAGSES